MPRLPSPILSSTSDVVEARPARFLRALPQYGVLLCTEHRTCYTIDNYKRHINRDHGLKGQVFKDIQEWVNGQQLADEVTRPAHHGPPIVGLAVRTGWACNVGDCPYLTTSEELFGRHCSQEHFLNSKKKQREKASYSEVQLQSFFAKSKEYFIVDPSPRRHLVTTPIDPNRPAPLTSSTPVAGQRSTIDRPQDPLHEWAVLSQRFKQVQEIDQARYGRLQEPQHVSEITPWLRRTDFHRHLAGVDTDILAASYEVPKSAKENARLFHVSQSVDRVLRQSYATITELHRLDKQILNSFQANTVSQDPFDRLQEEGSLKRYILTFQKLLCYVLRVSDGHFGREMFQITQEQRDCVDRVEIAVDELMDTLDEGDSVGDDGAGHEGCLDRHALALCVALIKHRLPASRFHSAVLSFCAVLAWDDPNNTWIQENQYSGSLSALIYDSQLIMLQHARDLVSEAKYAELGDALMELQKQWMANNSRGPVGELDAIRLYTMAIGSSAVNPAQIRWHRDGHTFDYKGITYTTDFLVQEINYCLEHAHTIFRRDLCLGLPNIPVYQLQDLRDNWDSRKPGLSFINDPRNQGLLEGGSDWFLNAVRDHPTLSDAIFYLDEDTHEWRVRSEFAQQYEQSVQDFLEYMLVLVHKGSGQPARKPEFLGTRWRNVGFVKRNIFLHDGYLLFLLTYHKSATRVHASRFPVRFLLPEAGILMVQFLVLVQPVRRFFCEEVRIPAEVTEYLWSDGRGIWAADRMTRIVKKVSKLSVGIEVNIQEWRQMAVGMAIKHFHGPYQGDFDLPGDADDDLQGHSIFDTRGSLADVFHHQATHGPRTGNRSYGGTVDFNAGLTDAGLQEYLLASQTWHRFCRPRRPDLALTRSSSSSLGLGHRRHPSSTDIPLAKRVALQHTPRRHLRRWGTETILATLQRLHPNGPPRFRSPKQEEAINCIASGHAEVIAILATGEGKSLLFLLPSCLPQAATTVVVVALVVLKQDLARRCDEAGVPFAVWDRQSDEREFIGVPLLFVAVESTHKSRFRSLLGKLDAAESLDRVVFDECHLILTASEYRPKMALVKHLRSFRCQVVFLTATLPPLMLADFQRRMLLSQPKVIRSRTFRRDIFYHIKRANACLPFMEYMVQGIRRSLRGISHEAAARAIVYSGSRAEADELATALSCPVYYSDSGDLDEKAAVLARWRDGGCKVVVATSAFGMGVDYPAVRTVIHAGAPRDAISFAQEVGRLGRDGRGGTSRIVIPHHWQAGTASTVGTHGLISLEKRAMATYMGGPRCLAAVLSRFQDGRDQQQYCQAADAVLRCTACQQYGLFDTGEERDDTRYWDVGGEAERSAVVPSETDDGQGDGNSGEEQEVDSEEEAWQGLSQGGVRLRQQQREEEQGRRQFVQRLRSMLGCCMICSLLGSSGAVDGSAREARWHGMKECRNGRKFGFFKAKKAAVDAGRASGGWLRRYVACFRCGNPQDVCGQQGSDECEYTDVVLPASWALFHMSNRWGQTLGGICGRDFKSEEQWMGWLGEECELHGMRACQGARMAGWVLERMVEQVTGG